MGGDRPYTAAELAQRERDQRDPAFQAWLGAKDADLALFFEQDVPDMPADPWTEEGLRHAEQAALAYYWADSPMDLDWPEREKRFARYLGEVFVRSFEGSWMWIDVTRKGAKEPVVSQPTSPEYLRVVQHVGGAMGERTGEFWARLYRYASEDYDNWVAAGRLDLPEWVEYVSKHRL